VGKRGRKGQEISKERNLEERRTENRGKKKGKGIQGKEEGMEIKKVTGFYCREKGKETIFNLKRN